MPPQPAQAAEDAADAVVDVDDAEVLIDDEEVDVVDPFDLGPERVDDLFVQELVAKEDLVVGHLERSELRLRSRLELDDGRIEAQHLLPVEIKEAFLFAFLDGQAGDLGKSLPQLRL